MLTRRDLDQIAERLGVPAGPAVPGAALLRQRLAEAWAVLDAVARQDVAPTLALAARALLAAHGHPSWTPKGESRG